MLLDRLHAEPQRERHTLVGFPQRDVRQHFALALGDPGEHSRCRSQGRLVAAQIPRHQPRRDRLGEVLLARDHGTDRLQQLRAAGVLEHVAVGAGAERCPYVLVRAIRGEHQYMHARRHGAQLLDDPQPLGARGGEVRDDERRIGALHHPHAVRSGTSLADHTEVGFQLDQRAQSLAQNSVRLDDHDARVRRGFDHHSQTPAGVPPALCWLKLLGEPCDESGVRSEDMLR